jgi:hypothetical protein
MKQRLLVLIQTCDDDPSWIDVQLFEDPDFALIWLGNYIESDLTDQGKRTLTVEERSLIQEIKDKVADVGDYSKNGFRYRLSSEFVQQPPTTETDPYWRLVDKRNADRKRYEESIRVPEDPV